MAMMPRIPHSRPCLGPEEAEAAGRVLASGQLAQGPEVEAFEHEFAGMCCRAHGVAVSSGTAALQLALEVLGVWPRSHVVLPEGQCPALNHAILAAGGEPFPVPVDPLSHNLTSATLSRYRGDAAIALIVTHAWGLPTELVGAATARIVEDFSHAPGAWAWLSHRPAGSLGLLSVCSFYATKMLTTGGEGGIILTDDAYVADLLRRRRSSDAIGHRCHNFKMTEMQAAVGRVQLRRLVGFLCRRWELAERYAAALTGKGLQLPGGPGHVYYRYVVGGVGAEALQWHLEALGIDAKRVTSNGLVSVPLYPALTEEEEERIIAALASWPGREVTG